MRRTRTIRSVTFYLALVGCVLCVQAQNASGPTAPGPTVSGTTNSEPAKSGPATPAPATPGPAKSTAFDVVSIRQNVSTDFPRNGPPPFGPTATGYRMTNSPLLLPILAAYVPQGGAAAFTPDRISGLPDWAMQERWDIDARVSDEDIAAWQKPASQAAMLPAMMQAMLVERCKLAVHREMKESAVYLLVLGKSGPKFKETNPDEEHPGGFKLPWGGVLVPSNGGTQTLYGASMASVASVLSLIGGGGGNLGRQIQDKTGLTGKYDITVKPPAPTPGEPYDPSAALFSMVEELGLKLESAKSQVETLVVDHIEKPSAN
jgi:bla regulator protein BlaR1